MTTPLQVLIVEDSENDALLIIRELRRGGYEPIYERVETRAAMQSALDKTKWDVILCDYSLPHFSGPEALAFVKERGLDMPFIIVTGTIGDVEAVSSMKAGAHDYILKGNLTRLPAAIERELREAITRRERRLADEMLKASEERYKTILETAQDAIICLEYTGKISVWNKKAEEMFGYPPDEMIGKELYKIIVPERYRVKTYDGLKTFFRTGAGPVVGKTVELSALRKDGTEFPIDLSISAMRIRGEWQATGIIRDVTERKQAEERLKQQVEELERFKKATIQREIRMKELRTKVEKLEK
jgi:PAS domain S-box-containing protein